MLDKAIAIYAIRPVRKFSFALLVDLFVFTYTRNVYRAGRSF